MGRPAPGDITLGSVDAAAIDSGKLYVEVTTKSGTTTRSAVSTAAP
jgi:hypothetical protein